MSLNHGLLSVCHPGFSHHRLGSWESHLILLGFLAGVCGVSVPLRLTSFVVQFSI